MRRRIDSAQNVNFTRELLIGLGESSVRKSYYPELQKRMGELERFRLLIDQALDAIYLLDSSTGKILDANATACSYCGCAASDLIGADIGEWLSCPGGIGEGSQVLACGIPSRSADCEFHCWDGSTMPVDVSTSQVALQDGTYLVIVARDITEQRSAAEHLMALHEELHANYEELQSLYGQVSHTEESLRKKVDELQASQAALAESESRYRLAMEGANDAIWDWDIRRNEWSISSQWVQRLGFCQDGSRDYITFLDSCVHSADAQRRQKALADHLAGKTEYYEVEYRIQLPSKKWVWILSKGKALFDDTQTPTRMCGSYTDITERKRQEEHMEYLAYHDPLTGLDNRYCFY